MLSAFRFHKQKVKGKESKYRHNEGNSPLSVDIDEGASMSVVTEDVSVSEVLLLSKTFLVSLVQSTQEHGDKLV